MNNENMVRAIEDRLIDPPDDDEPMEYCCWCEAPLYIGEYSWEIGGKLYCDECAKEIFRKLIKEE